MLQILFDSNFHSPNPNPRQVCLDDAEKKRKENGIMNLDFFLLRWIHDKWKLQTEINWRTRAVWFSIFCVLFSRAVVFDVGNGKRKAAAVFAFGSVRVGFLVFCG